jgi:hypothetical protein
LPGDGGLLQAAELMYRGAVLHIEWQTITWLLVSAILAYFIDGPNLISYALAVIGVMAAFAKAGLEQWAALAAWSGT